MKQEIVPNKEGYSVTDSSKTIFFPNAELANVGCRNCVWKLHNQCPYNLKDDELIEGTEFVDTQDNSLNSKTSPISKGICPEMLNFLISLAEKGDNSTAVWEKFLIYKARIQESEDYRDFLQLENEAGKLEEEISKLDMKSLSKEKKEEYRSKRAELNHNKASAKMWWIRLNQQATISLQKIGDRQSKEKGGAKIPGILMKGGTINFGVKEKIEDKSKE